MEATQVSASPTSDGLQRAVWILVAGYYFWLRICGFWGQTPPKSEKTINPPNQAASFQE